MQLPQKHTASGTTIFSVMSALAQEHDAINLSQGFPDFPVDPALEELVGRAVREGWNQYAPMPGLPLLRQAIATGFAARYGVQPDPETEITVTPGATYAIYTAFTAILQPGDEVIVLEPAYDSYIPNIEMNGARAVTVPLTAPLFSVDWDRLQAAITPATKAIIVNTPHNPTGAVWSREDWDRLAAVLDGTDIFVLSDEVYEQLTYDGRAHISVWQHEALRSRSFALYSFGKSLHNTGWKIGYCIAPPELTAAFRRIHQYLSFSVNTPAQWAIAQYLQQERPLKASVLLEQKRDHFTALLRRTPFQIYAPAAGSYFQLAGYSGLSDMGDKAFAAWLTRECGVATIPVSAFYRNGQDDRLLRFCFAKKEGTLEAAVERLQRLGIPA